MSDKYILDNRKAVRCHDLMAWARWFEDNFENRRVAETMVGNIRVSTVFLGLDHNWAEAKRPLLFESMAFGLPAEEDEWQERCSTWEQAEAMHAAMVERAKTVPQLIDDPAKEAT